ncbi:hypothetical protein BC940DRAFT_100249 [Gongronella butleri]|nr:hypothetical protein BC940DRAFT_100249 [Gongronella butleri]
MDAGQSQIRPFVYIQYPSSPSRPYLTSSTSPEAADVSISHTPLPVSATTSSHELTDVPPSKRKRQQNGYACDKCRERRVGCDRGKPVCGQCKGKYQCGYSNHALRLDNVSMRQKMNDLEAQVKTVKDDFARLQHVCYQLAQRQQQLQSTLMPMSSPTERDQLSMTTTTTSEDDDVMNGHDASTTTSSSGSAATLDASIVDWAMGTGYQVSFNDGITSIFTDISSFDGLRDAVRRALQLTYHVQGPTLYATLAETPQIALNEIPSFSSFERLGRIQPQHDAPLLSASTSPSSSSASSPASASSASSTSSHSHHSHHPHHASSSSSSPSEPDLLASDVMTRLIHQHHQCGFPILVSPSRFERHYQQGELKSVVLSSICSHIAPHACVYHPHLVHLHDFRALGQRFYEHSRMQLGLDDQANLSNIHQRTLLLAYDLDFGHVERAFVQLGLVIRMCFTLDLHRPEGYIHCQSAFEREQAKRIFWAVWFFDSMVPHFFAQPSTIRREDIKIDLPCVLSEYDPVEIDQTRFAIALIQVRRLHSEKSLRRFYRSLSPSHRFRHLAAPAVAKASLWHRRSFYCILLDYCLAWLNLSRPRLPSTNAIRRTSQTAFAMLLLFRHWFRPAPDFDCFFRPYLHHFMAIIQVFKVKRAIEKREREREREKSKKTTRARGEKKEEKKLTPNFLPFLVAGEYFAAGRTAFAGIGGAIQDGAGAHVSHVPHNADIPVV